MFTTLGWLYHHYFRVTVAGIEHIPTRGPVMLVCNHSGGWAVDALMVLASVFFELESVTFAPSAVRWSRIESRV